MLLSTEEEYYFVHIISLSNAYCILESKAATYDTAFCTTFRQEHLNIRL